MKDIKAREDVRVLVDSFYEKVKKDELLAPVFGHVDWPHHLPIMYDFWSSILLGDMSYNGSPFSKHLGLPITQEHFTRWLKLFIENVDTQFTGPVAEEAKTRANAIANLFQFKLGLMK
jgi:hemoglobin